MVRSTWTLDSPLSHHQQTPYGRKENDVKEFLKLKPVRNIVYYSVGQQKRSSEECKPFKNLDFN